MNKERMVKVGLAIVLAAAAGLFLDHHPSASGTVAATAKGDGEVLRLLREPRWLPDIGFTDSDGFPLRLSSFRGKLILLNIWATWCVPCRKEMPALDRLQARFGGTDFEVVALSVDRNGLPSVKLFYPQTGIRQLRIYLDKSGQTMLDLGVAAIPATVLIDRHGNEIGRKIGPAAWDSPALTRVIWEHLEAPANSAKLPDQTPLNANY